MSIQTEGEPRVGSVYILDAVGSEVDGNIDADVLSVKDSAIIYDVITGEKSDSNIISW